MYLHTNWKCITGLVCKGNIVTVKGTLMHKPKVIHYMPETVTILPEHAN